MMNGPKSREETPKEGSDTRQRRISHRSNIAPQRTKFKSSLGIAADRRRSATF